MIFKQKNYYFVFLLFCALSAFALCACYAAEETVQQSDQQIMDFSLTSFGEKGKKSWDLSGKSADIFTDVVKLKDVIGNLYGKEENVKLTAKKGDFDKTEGKVHLEDDVVITTSSGTKMTTDSLDWDRKNQLLTTEDFVNIERENMVTTATGARGEPNLKKVNLEKDVQVNINPEQEEEGDGGEAKKKTVITCDGPLEIDYEKNIATFNNNVKVDNQDVLIYSDTMDVYFASSGKKEPPDAKTAPGSAGLGSKIEKIVSRGNVRIIRGENVSYSDEATYNASDKKIMLAGRPKLVIYSTEDMSASLAGGF